MRVLYLMPQSQVPGGLAGYSFLDEELFGLAAAGIDAWFLSTWPGSARETNGVKVRSVPKDSGRALVSNPGFVLRSAVGTRFREVSSRKWYRALGIERFAAELVTSEGIDVIHSHFGWPAGMGGVAAIAATGRPLVASLRGTDLLADAEIGYGKRRTGLFDRAIRRLVGRADRTLYFSDFMKKEGIALGADPARARVIRKGVDLRHFYRADDRLALRRSLGLSEAPMVLSVAGLIPRKGIDTTLEALAALETTEFQFVVCGDGPDRASLEALASTLGLSGRVHFMGRVPRDRIQHYFAACDVFVLASRLEAAGNVLFEAMASARPIVCTDAGGPGEYVQHERTGLVVRPGDVAALSAAVGAVLADPEYGDRLGEEGRRVALGEFGYDRMISDIREVYEEVASERLPLTPVRSTADSRDGGIADEG